MKHSTFLLQLFILLLVTHYSPAQNTFPSSGNVGIGTTAPTQLLQVNGGNIQTNGAVYAENWFRSFGNSGWYNETYAGGWYMSDATWIRSYGGKNVYSDQVIRADGGFQVNGQTVIRADGAFQVAGQTAIRADGAFQAAGQTVIDADAGWHRTYGPTGWYNGTYGGGWHMSDATWIRSYGGKNVYSDQMIRADGGFQVAGQTVIDAGAGWHRTYGPTGWYNGTYEGGIYMSDNTWVRVYNHKLFYSSNTMRTDGELQVGPDGNRLLVTGAGNVKIGSVNMPAGYKLYVESGILTEKVKVSVKTSGDWSDHVFNKDYPLMPLNEVEAFVKKNSHLPGIPAATEMVKNGNDLGQTDARLLEKIEELTLYIIQQQKQIQKMEEKINTLQKPK